MEGSRPKKEGGHHVHVNPTPSEIIEDKDEWPSSSPGEDVLFPVSSEDVESLMSIVKSDLNDIPYAKNIFLNFAHVLLSRRSNDPEQLLIDYLSSKMLPTLQSLPHHRRISEIERKLLEEEQESVMEKEANQELQTSITLTSTTGENSAGPIAIGKESTPPTKVEGDTHTNFDLWSSRRSLLDSEAGSEKPLMDRLCGVASCPEHRAVLEPVARLLFLHRPSNPEDFLFTRWEGAAFGTEDVTVAMEGRPKKVSENIANQLERLIPYGSVGRPVAKHAIGLLLSARPDNPVNFLSDYYGSRLIREDFPCSGMAQGGGYGIMTPVCRDSSLTEGGVGGQPLNEMTSRRESLGSHGTAQRPFASTSYFPSSVSDKGMCKGLAGVAFNMEDLHPQRPSCTTSSLQDRKFFSAMHRHLSSQRRFSFSHHTSQSIPHIPEVLLSSSRVLPYNELERFSPGTGGRSFSTSQNLPGTIVAGGCDGASTSRDVHEVHSPSGTFSIPQGTRTSIKEHKMMVSTPPSTTPPPCWGSQRGFCSRRWAKEDPILEPNKEESAYFSCPRFRSSTTLSQPFEEGKRRSVMDEKNGAFGPHHYVSSSDRFRQAFSPRSGSLDKGIGVRSRGFRGQNEVEDNGSAELDGSRASWEEQQEEADRRRQASLKPSEFPFFSMNSQRPRSSNFSFCAMQRDLLSFQMRNEFRLATLSHEVEQLEMEKNYREKVVRAAPTDENYFLLQKAYNALEDGIEYLDQAEGHYTSTLQTLNQWIQLW